MVKPFRKWGHIIVHEMAEAKKIAQKVKQMVKAKAK